MKEWHISYTYLDTIQVPDDWDYDKVMEWAIGLRPADGCDDIEIMEVKHND